MNTIYETSVPVFQLFFKGLSDIQEIGAKHCQDKQLDEAWMLETRLYPDMFPLWRQFTRTIDHARRATALLARVANDEKPDVPATSFADLGTRIASTQAFLAAIKPEQMEGAGEEAFEIKAGPNVFKMTGTNYLHLQALPQFFFHAATAYDILRHNGVELGKRHYMAVAHRGK